MASVSWSSSMKIGIPSVDEAHHHLLDAVQLLASVPDAQFAAAFNKLVAAFENDFRVEEELMERLECPSLRPHREQHARVLSALHHVASEVLAGNAAPARQVIELLPQWFLLHMSTMDAALAAYCELTA